MKAKIRSNPRKKFYYMAGFVVGLVCLGLIFFLLQSGDAPNTIIPVTDNSSDSSSTTQNTQSNTDSNQPTSQPTSQKSPSVPTQSAVSLVSPYGAFVSNHKPSLSGSPTPSQVQSTCTTAPGAKCYIKFTNGNLAKTLPEQTTGSDGTTSWDWDVKTAGFSAGAWQISAIATLNSVIKTTKDTVPFEVQL